MSDNSDSKPVDNSTARATLANLRRMLQGQVPFPKDSDAAFEMVKAGVPVLVEAPEDPPFYGTSEEVLAGFEAAAEKTVEDTEYWSARVLMSLLGYGNWQNFEIVVEKAQIACNQSGHTIADHFDEVVEMVDASSTVERGARDLRVTRYGAYLIALNGDSRKRQVAIAQTYFAVQSRRQELHDHTAAPISEQQRRIALRDKIAEHNKDLAGAAQAAGVISPVEFAIFQNFGYRGLYNGLDAAGIKDVKGLPARAKILDHMGSTELAANLFRATQAEEKLRRDGTKGRVQANDTHLEVGKKVRKAIEEIGGTMPEKLGIEEDIGLVRKRLASASNKAKEIE